ncbi:MAG: Mu transposase C-terminal domain-containing protein [Fibrobacterota bacterium]
MGEAALAIPHFDSLPEVWITTDVVAELLGVSQRSVLRSRKQYRTRLIPRTGRGGERYEVLLSSLPIEAIDAWEVRQRMDASREQDVGGDLAHAYQRADQRARRHFDRWSQVLQATDGISGRKALEQWCEEWNRANPENAVALQSLYRVRAKVQDGGLISLLLRDTQLPSSTVSDEWFAEFCRIYLQQSRLSLSEAHRKTYEYALESASQDLDSFPSVHAFQRRLEKKYSTSAILFAREGEKKFYDKCGYYIQRDYSDVIAGRVWVGDSRILDLLVRDEHGCVFRPYVTALVCMKSYTPMGWHFHAGAPSAENTMRALRHGIIRYGKPDDLYLDNGRENRNKEVSGHSRGNSVDPSQQHMGSLAAILKIRVHFAAPYNARAKQQIERNLFKEMSSKFDRYWTSWCGGNIASKPERLKEEVADPARLPTFDEVRQAMDVWLSERIPLETCNGQTHLGRSRIQVLQDDYATHGPLPHVSDDTTAMLVTKLVPARIGRTGIRVASLDNSTWYADWMIHHPQAAVVLRYDPENLSTAWVHANAENGYGPLLGTCTLVQAVGALVRDGDVIGRAQIVQGMNRKTRQLKAMRAAFPKATAEDLELLRSRTSARMPEVERSSVIASTGHDYVAAHVRREQRSGRADLTQFIQPSTPKRPAGEFVWLEGQMAAG